MEAVGLGKGEGQAKSGDDYFQKFCSEEKEKRIKWKVSCCLFLSVCFKGEHMRISVHKRKGNQGKGKMYS